MSVDTADAPPALASDDHAAPAPRPRRKVQTAPPRPLTLICERCERAIRGTGAGFAYVDLRDAQRAATGRADKARWSVAHKACVPEAVAPINPYFRIWAERIGSADELLDAVAELSRLSWFAATDWGALVRRVLADTDHRSDTLAQRRAQHNATATNARARRAATLAPDDPRHGTLNGYNNCGCRCDDCRQAVADASRRKRADKALPATHSHEHGSDG